MGYYVNIVHSTAVLPKENVEEAYTLMCELNQHNDLKTGRRSPHPEGLTGPHDAIWFAWMPWNYPETMSTAREILEALGFSVRECPEGDLHIEYYDSKTGAEKVFFEAIGHLVDGVIKWLGEDGDSWVWTFDRETGLEAHYCTCLDAFM